MRDNFKTLKILNSSVQLLGYEDNTMKPLGQLGDLRVTLNGKTANLSSLILKGNELPLIGRQWLKALGLWPLNIFDQHDITAK